MNIAEEYRKAFEAGYFWGRMDALEGHEYDDRTPLDRKKADEELTGETGNPSETGNHWSSSDNLPSETPELEAA